MKMLRYTPGQAQARGLPGPMQSANASPAAFGAGPGQALEEMGQRVQNLAGQVDDTRRRSNALRIAEVDTALGSWEVDRLQNQETGAFTVTGGAAEGLAGKVGTEFDEQVVKLRQDYGISDPDAVRELSRMALARKQGIMTTLARHERQQMQVHHASIADTAADTAISGAVDSYTDKNLAETRLGQGEQSIRAALAGEPEEVINQRVARLYSGAIAGIIRRQLAAGDTDAAVKWYKANGFHLLAEDRLQVLEHLDPAALKQEARRLAAGILAGNAGVATDQERGGNAQQAVVDAIHQSESGGDPQARNSRSSATGAGQFIASTWLDTVRKHRPDLAEGKSEADVLALRTDPALSREMTGRLASDNAEVLGRQGIEATPANLMLAHRFGAAGAAAILSAPADNPMATAVGPDAMKANPDLDGKTTGDMVGWAGGRMAGIGGTWSASRQAGQIAQARAVANPRLADLTEAFVRSGLADQDRARAEAERQAEEVRARKLSDLDIALSRGQAGLPEIEGAYAAGTGWLKPAERTRLVQQEDKRLKEQAETVAEFGRVVVAVEGNGVLDPRSDKDRKAVSTHFAGVAAGWQGLPPEEQVDRAVRWASRYGMVPDQIRANLRGSLRRADSPELVVSAADTLERLRNANPALLDDFGQEDIVLGNLVGTYSGYGMAPSEAVKLATEAAKVPPAERETRRETYQQTVKDAPAASGKYLRDNLVGGWWARHMPLIGVPNVSAPPELVAEFDTLAGDEFARSGNMDAARKTALDSLRRVWGMTMIGGGAPDGSGAAGAARLMRYPPEMFYGRPNIPPEDNAAWMRDQLVSDVTGGNVLIDDPGSVKDRFMLSADPSRRDPATGGPLYQIHLRRRDGTIDTVRDASQRPRLWRPDWTSSAAAARQRREIEAMRPGQAQARPSADTETASIGAP